MPKKASPAPLPPCLFYVATIQASAKKYKHVGYNKAALAFIEAGGNDTKNRRCEAVKIVIAISLDNQLLLPCYYFAKLGFPSMGSSTTSTANREEVEYRQS